MNAGKKSHTPSSDDVDGNNSDQSDRHEVKTTRGEVKISKYQQSDKGSGFFLLRFFLSS